VVVLLKKDIVQGLILVAVMFLIYIPLGYATDMAIFRFRQKKKAQQKAPGK
jgi:hypothetical protein